MLEKLNKPVCVKSTSNIHVSALLVVVHHKLIRLDNMNNVTAEAKAAVLLAATEEHVVDNCCTTGDVDTLRWILDAGKRGTRFALKNSVAAGQLDAVKMLCSTPFASEYYYTDQVMETAISIGDVQVSMSNTFFFSF